MVVGVETVTSFFIGGEGQNYLRHSHLARYLALLNFCILNEKTAHIACSSGILDVLICLSIPHSDQTPRSPSPAALADAWRNPMSTGTMSMKVTLVQMFPE